MSKPTTGVIHLLSLHHQEEELLPPQLLVVGVDLIVQSLRYQKIMKD
jgi:hypothetical protein